MTKGQQPGESDREYLRRLSEESAAQLRKEKREMRGDPRERAAQDDRDAKMDRSFDAGFEDLLGGSAAELRREFDEDSEAGKAVRWADQAWTQKGKAARAKKIKPKVDKARKSKGCLGVLVVLAGSATAVGYGLYEAASAALGWS